LAPLKGAHETNVTEPLFLPLTMFKPGSLTQTTSTGRLNCCSSSDLPRLALSSLSLSVFVCPKKLKKN
jgi:hypothetical protein